MKAPRRSSSSSSSRKTVRRAVKAESISREEVERLENEAARFAASERAWQRMTSPLADDDPWTKVEDHLLEGRGDPDRGWKFYSK